MKIVLAVLLALFVCLAYSEVTVLTQDTFDQTSSGVWLIKFYAPWCGHCKKLAPTWDELATVVGSNFHVAKVDCTIEKDLCQKHEIRGYPTLLTFKDGKSEKYSGQRTIVDFVTFIENKYPDTPKTTVAGKPEPKATAPPAPPAAPAPEPVAESTSDVVVLTDSTFDVARTGVWLVDFYAPWCGHCKKLSPIWDELATVAKKSGLYKVAKVDVTTEKNLGTEFGIRSLPTIKLFINGKETAFSGDRTVESFNKFVLEAIASTGAAPAKEEAAPVKAEAAAVNVERENGVYILTNENFDSTIAGKDFFIKFYAPWCGHCKKMAPTWGELATSNAEFNIGKVDCTIHKDVCSRYEVKGFPTLILLKSDNSQVKYQGARSVDGFVSFLKQNA